MWLTTVSDKHLDSINKALSRQSTYLLRRTALPLSTVYLISCRVEQRMAYHWFPVRTYLRLGTAEGQDIWNCSWIQSTHS